MPDSLTEFLASQPIASHAPSLWLTVVVPLLSALLGAVLGPFLSARWRLLMWRRQKISELKYDIFRGAVQALAAWACDALDVELQAGKGAYKGASRAVEMRPTTAESLSFHQGLLSTFFTPGTAAAYSEAVRAPISIENVPNAEFEQKRAVAIAALAREVDLLARGPDA